MTLKELRNLELWLRMFKIEYIDNVNEAEWDILCATSKIVKKRLEEKKLSPEGQAELLREKMDDCPIE